MEALSGTVQQLIEHVRGLTAQMDGLQQNTGALQQGHAAQHEAAQRVQGQLQRAEE